MQSSMPGIAQPIKQEETVVQQASSKRHVSAGTIDEEELRAIFERTYGPIKDRGMEAFRSSQKLKRATAQLSSGWVSTDDYLLVDGYNIIFAWPDTSALARENLEAARELLLRRLENYQGVCACRLIVVFDAYKVKGGVRSVEEHGKIHIVYTKEKETADMYIEKVTRQIGKNYRVRVATSDAIEQTVTLGRGAVRISSREFLIELAQTRHVGRRRMKEEKVSRGDIFSRLPPHQREIFDRMRKGED